MDWAQFILMILAFVGLFTWNRSESRSDFRMVMTILNEMKEEMKDFHGRLVALEERKGKK